VKRKSLFFIFFLFLNLFFVKPACAESDFAVAENAKYQFYEDGTSSAYRNIKLINLSTNYYPAFYVLSIPLDSTNIVAFDTNGKITPEIVENERLKKLILAFNRLNPGINNSIAFAVSYTTKSFFLETDEAKRILIPIDKKLNYVQYDLELVLPQSFGTPILVKPEPREGYFWSLQELTDENLTLDFSLQKQKISQLRENGRNTSYIIAGIILGIFIFAILYLVIKAFNLKK